MEVRARAAGEGARSAARGGGCEEKGGGDAGKSIVDFTSPLSDHLAQALSENADELYAWEKAIVDSRIPLSERRRSSAALATRAVNTHTGDDTAQVDDNGAQAGVHNAQANGNGPNVTYDLTTTSATERLPIDMATIPGATVTNPSTSPYQAVTPAVRMCTVSHCHQVLPRAYQYKR